MKKGWVIVISVVVAILLLIVIVANLLPVRLCGTPYYVRNAANQCEIKVGCSLPAGVTEDPSCREILRQQIDENKNLTEINYTNNLLLKDFVKSEFLFGQGIYEVITDRPTQTSNVAIFSKDNHQITIKYEGSGGGNQRFSSVTYTINTVDNSVFRVSEYPVLNCVSYQKTFGTPGTGTIDLNIERTNNQTSLNMNINGWTAITDNNALYLSMINELNKSTCENGYVCPNSGKYIDCMPALSLEKSNYCMWVRNNCPNASIAE